MGYTDLDRYKNAPLDEKRSMLGGLTNAMHSLSNENYSEALKWVDRVMSLWGVHKYSSEDLAVAREMIIGYDFGAAKQAIYDLTILMINSFAPAEKNRT